MNHLEDNAAARDRLERRACLRLDPEGFYIRHPPPPHCLNTFITPEDQLFHTIHMGAAVVDPDNYVIKIDGLVKHPLCISLPELKQMESRTITAFHECYGSPIKLPTENVWRIGNVRWTGVPLKSILVLAQPLREARFIWSEGLDYGEFAGVQADRYQKDLPVEKATSPEVLLAYEINGSPIDKKRGGPVRLIVPGYFGTNMTKWLCRLSLQNHRATGPFTTTFYNEKDPTSLCGKMRAVWMVEPNSMIIKPAPDERIPASDFEIVGWAWSDDGIIDVEIKIDNQKDYVTADLDQRIDFSWQRFRKTITLSPGSHQVTARAKSASGLQQPISGRRNHVHTIHFTISDE